jgi:hypothetical protein
VASGNSNCYPDKNRKKSEVGVKVLSSEILRVVKKAQIIGSDKV